MTLAEKFQKRYNRIQQRRNKIKNVLLIPENQLPSILPTVSVYSISPTLSTVHSAAPLTTLLTASLPDPVTPTEAAPLTAALPASMISHLSALATAPSTVHSAAPLTPLITDLSPSSSTAPPPLSLSELILPLTTPLPTSLTASLPAIQPSSLQVLGLESVPVDLFTSQSASNFEPSNALLTVPVSNIMSESEYLNLSELVELAFPEFDKPNEWPFIKNKF